MLDGKETQADVLLKTRDRRYSEGCNYAFRRVCDAGADQSEVKRIINEMELSIALADLGQGKTAFDEGVMAYIRKYQERYL